MSKQKILMTNMGVAETLRNTVISRWYSTYWFSDCGLKLAAVGLVDVTAELRGVEFRDSVAI
jgi:hypothetical protein